MKKGAVERLNVYLNYISLLGCVRLSLKRSKTSYIYDKGHSRRTQCLFELHFFAGMCTLILKEV